MSSHEKSGLYNGPSSFKPLMYRLYVDDCFLLFKSSDHVPLFLSYLNRQHPNISFSSELEKDGKLPFLDVEITRSNGRFSTSVYRKPTFSDLFTNFHSFVPSAYKRSLACCLLHRIFHLCSLAFLSLVRIPSRFALKLHDFVVLLILISTFALSFALLRVSPLSFLLRIEFPSF